MSFKPGELVIRKWSKAGSLKGKVFRVIGDVPKPPNASYYIHTTKVRCAAPNGSQKEIYEYRLRSLKDELSVAKTAVDVAEKQLAEKQAEYTQLAYDLRSVESLFPPL